MLQNKKLIAALLALSLSGCSVIQDPDRTAAALTTTTEQPTEPVVIVTTAEETAAPPPVTTAEITSIPLSEPAFPPAEIKDFEIMIEAEDEINVQTERAGYSGEGYISGASSVVFRAELPTAQHYSIIVSAAADRVSSVTLLLNGETAADFEVSEPEFTETVLSGVFLSAGELSLSVREDYGEIDLDYIEIKSYNAAELTENVGADMPCDPAASPSAKGLMKMLKELSGKVSLSGQYVTPQTNEELELIYRETGRYPAVRFSDLSYLHDSLYRSDLPDDIDLALEWAEKGGLIGYSWHWLSPDGVPTVYTSETAFSLANAVTDIDIAHLTPDELSAMRTSGRISPECAAIVRDIDEMAEYLKIFAEKDIPVLFRPLHEADGDWFWWSADGREPYLFLWRLLYTRFTEYHGLHNLIWVWNGRSGSYYPGDEYCDIASCDVYTGEENYGSQLGEYIRINGCSDGQKMNALAECGSIPDPDLMQRDGAVWLWFSLWCGEYVIDYSGYPNEVIYNDKFVCKEQLVKSYNHTAVITLERLPNYQSYIESN